MMIVAQGLLFRFARLAPVGLASAHGRPGRLTPITPGRACPSKRVVFRRKGLRQPLRCSGQAFALAWQEMLEPFAGHPLT